MALNETKMAILQAEITGDPLARGYADMAEGAVAADLNASYRSGPITVPAATVRGIALMNGAWVAVEDFLQGSSLTAEQRHAGRTFILTLTPGMFDSFHMGDAGVRIGVTAAVDGLLAAGGITQDQHDAILAAGVGPISRAHELGIDGVDFIDVSRARGNI